MRQISFDVMLNERFICTLKMPITKDMVVDHIGERPVIKEEAFSDYVEKKRPSLRGKDYKIYFNV